MNEITPAQAFEEKIKDRLKRDLGDLIPDEMLTKLIEKAIASIFFEPVVSRSTYGNVIDSKPSWFQTEVERLLKARVQEFLNTYMKEHEAEIKEKFSRILETKGPELVANFFIGILMGQQSMMVQNLQNAFQTLLQNKIY
jgi:hypothetical protein